MKITFIRGTALGGVGNDAHPGDVRDIPDAQAKQLISAGRAVAGAVTRKPARTSSVHADSNGAAPPQPDPNTNAAAGQEQ